MTKHTYAHLPTHTYITWLMSEKSITHTPFWRTFSRPMFYYYGITVCGNE